MTDVSIEEIYSEAGITLIEQPGGYRRTDLKDPGTGRSMWLEDLDVPLELANWILEAHSEARQGSNRKLVTPWEATLEDLADDLYVRCGELERLLKERG